MNAVIQASSAELLQLIKQAVREELVGHINTHPKSEERSLNKREAAAYMRISLSTLERLIRSNQLNVYNIGKRILIKQQAIDKYIDAKGSKSH